MRLTIILLLGALALAGLAFVVRSDNQRLLRYPQVTNLRQIGRALDAYVTRHADRYPDDLRRLVDAGLLRPDVLDELPVDYRVAGRARADVKPDDTVASITEHEDGGVRRHTLQASGRVVADSAPLSAK